MLRKIPIVAAVCALMSAFAAGEVEESKKERLSLDKKPLPPIEYVVRKIDDKLPLIGSIFGATPEEAFKGKIWSLRGDTDTAKAIRKAMNDSGATVEGFDWIAEGLGGSSRTLIRLENGRVSGVALYYPGMSWSEAKSRGEKFREAGVGKKQEADDKGFVVELDDMTLQGSVIGKWTKVRRGESGVFGGTSDKRSDGPTMIVLRADPYDWVLIHNSQSAEMYQAAKDGKPKVGMNTLEMIVAMRAYKLYRIKNDDESEDWRWTRKVVEVIDQAISAGTYGTYVTTWKTVAEKPTASARFEGGKGVAFMWDIAEREAH